ncbi:hypothetical protein [Prosthecobacter sp.]|uniref:hypothetical protein n=1 Tax=Prosthecobacter sp. TaxID=1965333 RepID=UPI003783C2F8
MSFLFASSHLPQPRVQRPHDEEEEDEEMLEPARSGMVRATSHLSDPVRPTSRLPDPVRKASSEPNPVRKASSEPNPVRKASSQPNPVRKASPAPPRAEADGPASTRPATPVGRPRLSAELPSWLTETEETAHDENEPPSGREFDDGDARSDAREPDGSRSWHQTRTSAKDLPSPRYNEDEGKLPPRSSRIARSSSFDEAPPGSRRSPGVPSSPQQHLDDTFRPPVAGSPAATRGRRPEERDAPGGSLPPTPQQQAKPGGEPSSQQRLQESQRAISALKEQVRASNPPAQGGTAPQQNQTTDATKQNAGSTPPKDERDPLTIICEKFAAFPVTVEALKKLYTLPTGKMMIDKLATVADKIKVGATFGDKSFIDQAGVFRIRRNLDDEGIVAHELQHLGEMLFSDKNPFLQVEHPADAKAYPNLGNFDKEFRAMRIQNQIRLERARVNKINPLFFPHYYDGRTKIPIPGSLLPKQ